MTAVLVSTAVMLGVSGVLVLVRLLRGPTLHDRLVALDVLLVLVLSGIALAAALRDDETLVVLLVVVALVGFLSTMTAVRLLPEGTR